MRGIITPAPLHFVQQHSSHFPEIDPQEHRLTIHGMVDRPLSFTMDDLKRLPSVSRVHFLECQGNSSAMIHGTGNENMGPPVQYVWGMTSCSEWTGVPLSVLLNEAGVQKGASWLVYGRGGRRQVQSHHSAGKGHGRRFRGLRPEWRAGASRAGLPVAA